MSLSTGTRLGPYEIVGLIGAGGMGEVYKAHDSRLDRTVAIKVLPSELSADPARRARFEREAKTIAGLAHPHICTLHDVGEHAGSLFLVMEHLEGDTLAHRLQKGPLPLNQVLTIGAEITDGLSAAHRQRIIHRDLKPGNVMLTRAGAKLLDFGLAKLTAHGEPCALPQLAPAPTRSAPLTGQGVILGTAQYMAPEQVEGKPADARADLWALGAILYEMVAGKRPFEASSAASLIGAILEREPTPLGTLQPLIPPGLDRLVRRCLAKTPDDRPDTAHDLADELRLLRDSSSVGTLPAVGPRSIVSRTLRSAAVVLIAALLSAALTSWLWARWRPVVAPAPAIHAEISVRPAEDLNAGGAKSVWLPTAGGSRTALAWTPDGRSLVFVGRRGGVQQLYVRALDTSEARPLAGTDEAQAPALSADGRWVAFWAPTSLKKVPLAGGPVMELVSGMDLAPTGLVWDVRGGVFFGKVDGPIWHIPAGGVPAPVTTLGEAERAHAPSSVLPGDRGLLYTVRKRVWTWGDEDVVALELATGQRTVLLHDATDARYVPTGHLVFLRRGVLLAVPFDTRRLEVTGPPVPVVGGVAQALTGSLSYNITGAGQFTIAASGSLAWIPGAAARGLDALLVTVDRRGRVSPIGSPVRTYGPTVRVSPDGQRLAVSIRDLTDAGVWRYDIDRRVLTSLHRSGEASCPVWSPDGQRVVFQWLDKGRFSLPSQIADGSAPPEVHVTELFTPSAWAAGGHLVGVSQDDLAVARLERKPGHVEILRRTPDVEQWPEMSRDGRWLTFGSNASGRFEVYVEPYPERGARTLVSLEGGTSPAWHPNGRELFYVSLADQAGKRRMIAVDFEPGAAPRIGTPRVLFEFDPRNLGFSCIPVRCYDVAPDGQRFYVVQTPTPPPPPVVTHVNLVQNWFEELKSKVPPTK